MIHKQSRAKQLLSFQNMPGMTLPDQDEYTWARVWIFEKGKEEATMFGFYSSKRLIKEAGTARITEA